LIGFVLDEMFPDAAAKLLRTEHHVEAVQVREVGLGGATDAEIAMFARRENLGVVTENVADFAREADLVLVFVLKRNLPRGSAQATALAALLARWCKANPRPYPGSHWPVA